MPQTPSDPKPDSFQQVPNKFDANPSLFLWSVLFFNETPGKNGKHFGFGVWGLGCHLIVNFNKRIAEKLRRISLLHFGL